jgi:hypothetical protein
MITRSAPPRAAAKWIGITSAIVALGCPPPGGFPPPRPDWTTPLPTGVDSDAGTFRTRLDKGFPRSSTSHKRARAATCRPGSLDSRGHPRILCAVDVMIEPVGDTRLIDPDNAPAAGVAVARIENLDTVDTEAKFGFRPGIQAVYYLWVDRKPGSTKARWTVLQVPMGAGIVTAGYQKDLNLCNRYHEGEIRVSDADFYEYKYDDHPCDAAYSAQKSSVHQASFLSTEQFVTVVGRVAAFLRRDFSAASGGWISCSGGCCT